MKKSLLALLITASFSIHANAAIEFWHSNTETTDPDICSAHFTFDSNGVEISDLKVAVSALDKSGTEVIADNLEIESFGQGDIDRYADAELESGDMCQEGLKMVVSAATATIDGKVVDLLATKQLVAREFKPFKIDIGIVPLNATVLKRSHVKHKVHVTLQAQA
jgi:hypothetical protein